MGGSNRGLMILTLISAVLLLAAAYGALAVAPSAVGLTPDETAAQRIIYFHVPIAWLSMLAFGVTAIASIVYLITSKRLWDSLAVSSAELGIVFTLAAMASGSLWAKPAWNTWWTWDPRLTTYTIMFLLYVAYFMLRSAMDDPARRTFRGGLRHLRVPQRAYHIHVDPLVAHYPPGADRSQERFRSLEEHAAGFLSEPHRFHPVLCRAAYLPSAAGAVTRASGCVERTTGILSEVMQ